MGLVLAGLATALLVRVRGLTGDFFPVLEWRFVAPHDASLPPLPIVDDPPAAESPTAPAASGNVEPPTAASGDAADLSTSSAVPARRIPAAAARDIAIGARTDAAGHAAPSFPQFLGPDRTGVLRGVLLATSLDVRPPRLVWRHAVGAGWSGFAVADGLAITQEQRGGDEMVVAYDLMTGIPRWAHRDPIRYASVVAGDGPRATPTISGTRVATLGSTGLLTILDVRTGRRLWQKTIGPDNGALEPPWGRSGSPLVMNRRVIVSAGGPSGRSLVAYALDTGARVWSGGSDQAGYASPIVLTLLGLPQVVIFNQASLAGHDPDTGAALWSQPWPGESPNVAVPIRIADDLVLASTGYGVGSKLVKLRRAADGSITTSIVWESLRLKAKFTNPVLHEGFVYGLDDGVLTCIDAGTGERRWKAGRYGHGQTLLVADVLLVSTEDGEIVLVEPSPAGHHELGRFTALDGKTWNPPALAGKYLLVRNDREAALFEMALR